MKRFVLILGIGLFSINSHAANVYAGKAKVEAGCSQCHGLKAVFRQCQPCHELCQEG